MQTLGEGDILLVGVSTVERSLTSSLLTHEGYKPFHFSYAKFRGDRITTVPRLIIVDTKRRGNEVINAVKTKLVNDSGNEGNTIPPILAMVDTGLRHKREIFEYGAADYISCPLINAEFSYRVEHAIQAFDWQIQNFSSRPYYSRQDQTKTPKAAKGGADNSWPINKEHVLAIKTANYLKSRIGTKILLHELAKDMATNRNKLSQAFKGYYGITVFEWLHQQRMLIAAEMLRFSGDAVQQIAEHSGYPDSNNFSTAFKRTFHLSPLQYRKVQQTKNIVQQAKARE